MFESAKRLTPESWERRAGAPLAVAAVLFLVAYAVPILDRQIGRDWRSACVVADQIVWAMFAIDYLVRVLLAEQRWRYVGRHVPDLAMIALPVLRPLRLLRLVQLLKILNRQATDSLRGRIAAYVAGSAALLVLCAALAVLDAERRAPNANITTIGDALWWALSTVTTVGYGDHYPISTEGRFVAVGLMLAGIALLGVVTASIASWLIDRVKEIEQQSAHATQQDIHELREEIRMLRRALVDSGSVSEGMPPGR